MDGKRVQIGRETPRVDALERVTGQAQYAEDVYLPGMLYARVLRSSLPHARVRSIDASAAEALPGVMAVLHSFNTDTIWSAGDQLDTSMSERSNEGRRRLFATTARFVGEAVAAVAAVDRHTAEDALDLIKVEYEELPNSLSIEDSLKEDAPQIHEEGNIAGKRPLLNEWGNIEQGFAQADFIYESTFRSQHHNNAQMERRASVARWDGGKLTIWASTQGIYNCRRDIAADLKLPLSKVRVICQYMGGGFGNKNQGFDFDLMAALLAQKTGRPVRLEFTRREDFIAVHGRWATIQHYRIGYKKDGSLTAIHLKGYSGMGAYLRSLGGISGPQIYAAPNVRSEVSRVYTNTSCGANFRAPAYPQGFFAIESAMDEIAERLQMDPLEFRLKNQVRLWGNKRPLSSNGLEDCMRQGAAAFGWTDKRRQYSNQQGPLCRGVGMAMGCFTSSLGPSSALLKLLPDGSVKVYVGVSDIGTGAKTTMGVIAADTLGVPLETVSVVSGDTDVAPYSPGESGSRTTCYTGDAVVEAARKLREQLLAQAAAQFRLLPEELDLRQGKIVNLARPDQSWDIAEVTGTNVDAITVAVTSEPKGVEVERVAFAAHFAEVEVHKETGQVRVLRYVAAHDSGTIINKLTAASQVKGGVIQGLSMALREELIWDRHTGVPITNHYHGAKVAIHPEAPNVEVIFVEPEDPYGPFGAKALGEIPIVPVVGALANAIYHATGARIRELPITPDKLLNAFREARVKA